MSVRTIHFIHFPYINCTVVFFHLRISNSTELKGLNLGTLLETKTIPSKTVTAGIKLVFLSILELLGS